MNLCLWQTKAKNWVKGVQVCVILHMLNKELTQLWPMAKRYCIISILRFILWVERRYFTWPEAYVNRAKPTMKANAAITRNAIGTNPSHLVAIRGSRIFELHFNVMNFQWNNLLTMAELTLLLYSKPYSRGYLLLMICWTQAKEAKMH